MSRRSRPSSNKINVKFSYFPGCSLAASGNENNLSLLRFCSLMGIDLVELDDWNCCGSSSAHSMDAVVAQRLPERNLALAPEGRALLVVCPSCMNRLKLTHLRLSRDSRARAAYENLWQRDFDFDLDIVHFFEIFERVDFKDRVKDLGGALKQIRFAPYYGCMLAKPPELGHETGHYGLIEKSLSSIGAEPVSWPYFSMCCGTYLSVAKPDVATEVVNMIIKGAVDSGAECLVTACAMCHLNLEIRCTLKEPIPTLHFSELLSMALGEDDHKRWFPRHIVDPVPLLKRRGLI
ncbi:MAG: heterodisulfide reductase-related iron-sulfur binding cluster [Thermodesulfobacteriota bacterium]